jgi:hypothetical protein
MDYARACSWSTAVDNAVIAIEKAVAKKKSTGFQLSAQNAIIKPVETPAPSPDGVSQQVALLEAS